MDNYDFEMSPELIEQMSQGHMDPAKKALAARQYAQADALREQAMTPNNGRMVSGHYIAPGWGSILEKGIAGYMAGKSAQDAQGGLTQMGTDAGNRAKQFFTERNDAMRKARAGAYGGLEDDYGI